MDLGSLLARCESTCVVLGFYVESVLILFFFSKLKLHTN
jgi:hypothetical protein